MPGLLPLLPKTEGSSVYAGRVTEIGSAVQVLAEPSQPYTIGPPRSFPDIRDPERPITSIGGYPPRLRGMANGPRVRTYLPS